MPTVPILPEVNVNLCLIIFLGLATGMISGFAGVGGGFIMTPALIIMGVPAHYAVGCSMLWVMGNSLIGALKHHQQGNVDAKLALVTIIFMLGGIELGVRLLNYAQSHGVAENTVLNVSVVMLLAVGIVIFWEARPFKQNRVEGNETENRLVFFQRVRSIRIPPVLSFTKSGVKVSLFVPLMIGILTGILSGFIGVGGGFLLVPAFIYLLGVPSYTAVGTCLLLFIFSSAYGSIRHIISGNVLIYVPLLMLTASSLGCQIGALATRYVRVTAMRFILGNIIFLSALGSLLKLLSINLKNPGNWLLTANYILTFGGLALITAMVATMLIVGVRRQKTENLNFSNNPLIKNSTGGK